MQIRVQMWEAKEPDWMGVGTLALERVVFIHFL